VKSKISFTVEYTQELTESSQSNQPNRTPLYFCRQQRDAKQRSNALQNSQSHQCFTLRSQHCSAPKTVFGQTLKQLPARIFLAHISIALNPAGKLSLATFCIIRQEIWEFVSASAFSVCAAGRLSIHLLRSCLFCQMRRSACHNRQELGHALGNMEDWPEYQCENSVSWGLFGASAKPSLRG
jgi:hypothetical protein